MCGKKVAREFSYLFLLVFLFMLSGCVARQNYPENWERVNTSTEKCPNISGHYVNVGITSEKDYQSKLSHLFLSTPEPIDEVAFVAFDVKADSLDITAYNNNQVVAHKRYSYPSASTYCKEGYWVIEKNTFHNRDGAVAKEWKSYFLNINSQGLVINQKASTVGTLFLVPIVASDNHWVLFKRIGNQ